MKMLKWHGYIQRTSNEKWLKKIYEWTSLKTGESSEKNEGNTAVYRTNSSDLTGWVMFETKVYETALTEKNCHNNYINLLITVKKYTQNTVTFTSVVSNRHSVSNQSYSLFKPQKKALSLWTTVLTHIPYCTSLSLSLSLILNAVSNVFEHICMKQ